MKSRPRPWVQGGRRLRAWLSGGLMLLLVLVLVPLWRAPVQWGQYLDLQPPSSVVQRVDLPLAGPDGGQNWGRSWASAATQPRLVYLWATWCAVCAYSRPATNGLSESWQVQSVVLWSEGRAAVEGYLSEHPLAGQIWLDAQGELAQRWAVKAVPTVFVLNPEGRVIWAGTGLVTAWQLRLGAWLGERLLHWRQLIGLAEPPL